MRKIFKRILEVLDDLVESNHRVPNKLGRMTPEEAVGVGIDTGTRIMADRLIVWLKSGNRPWMGFQPGPELDLAVAIEDALQKARRGDASQHPDPTVPGGTVRSD